MDGKRYFPHRLSCEIYHGLDPTNSHLFACHKCEHRNCWNPDHLYIGTNHQNQRDEWEFCKRGHSMKTYGKYAYNINRRYCGLCHKERQKINNAKRSARLKAGQSNGVVAI